MIKIIFSTFALLTFVACASIKEAPEAQDQAAKQFKPISDKAALYIFRDETFGSALHRSISVDGKEIGETGPHSFFWISHAAGTCTLNSEDDSNSVPLSVEAGKIYYIWQEIKMGMFSGNTRLQVVDAKRGQEGVKSSRMIANQP